MIFIDTSAFLAVMDGDDNHHLKARDEWVKLIKSDKSLVCTNYIILETIALLQNRSGMKAVKIFQEDIIPVLTIEWIDRSLHQTGMDSLMSANRRHLSLVDCISFTVMRKYGIKKAFTFDNHFKEQGFICTEL